MLVSKEEHERDRVVQFVHLFKVGHLVEIADVDDGKVLDAVGDAVQHFVLSHAVGIPIAAKANDDQPLFLRHDGLVDVPAGDEMGEDDGTHGEGNMSLSLVCDFGGGFEDSVPDKATNCKSEDGGAMALDCF